MAWACCCGMGMLLWHGHVGGMGILVAWACWWNGHLARSLDFRAGRMPALLLFIRRFSNAEFFTSCLLPLASCLLPTPYSLLPTPYSLS
ncbi:hypothetical protein [Moorena sp. SIOASIH]|uniref:hypothetical protein n=1 Tax=Moorena sp. SIOASIH TaxID=2607817 RepID=UPI0025EAA392|nr:hypothetical protein [Moorena sp. SIOASIH]